MELTTKHFTVMQLDWLQEDLKKGQTINAVRRIKHITGANIREAKEFIDELRRIWRIY